MNPIVTIRSADSPYDELDSLDFSQSGPGGVSLPTLGGENSDVIYFRVYNNFGLAAGVNTMSNVKVTVFTDPFAQSWVRIFENGYGEGATTPGDYTRYIGQDTAIGNVGRNKYIPEFGSAGSGTPQIRAGSTTNGCGFIEFGVYLEVPDGAVFGEYQLSVSVEYT